jgi:hypothetical protein
MYQHIINGYVKQIVIFTVFIYMGKFILQESEKEQIRRMYGLVNEQTQSPEDNQEFLDWAKNATVMPFIAPNPYSNGDLKLGVQIKGNDGETISSMDLRNPNQSQVINLIERLDVTTEDGKLVYRFGTENGQLFNTSTFKANYEVIDNSYVVYSIVDENSDMIQKLKQFTKPGKINKFIVTVTPRLSSDLLKTGSKLFTTKPNVLIVQ